MTPNISKEEKEREIHLRRLNALLSSDVPEDEMVSFVSGSDIIHIKLTNEFLNAFNLLENNNDCVYITGKAGTGKSTLMKYFKSRTKKRVATLAFTGLAAINVEGVTIHSFFKFPLGFIQSRNVPYIEEMKLIYRTIDTIILDEVSMCRADIVDGMDKSLRMHRQNNEPFGGVQMIFIGDLYQLPPIVEDDLKRLYEMHYTTPFFFDAKVFKNKTHPVINLEKIHRQNDPVFIELLNNIRERRNLPATINALNQKVDETPKNLRKNDTIIICTTNEKAKSINTMFLSKLETPVFTYIAKVSGEFDEKSFPTNRVLDLKEGAKVIFIKNDPPPAKAFVNGDIGIVTRINPSEIHIRTRKGQIIVQRAIWDKIKYKRVVDKDKNGNEIVGTERIEKEVIGRFEQYPLKLAWAITVHKSQGQTYENVLIDFYNGCFASGQAYVALSRCRTFEGLRLKRPIFVQDIIVDDRIHNYTRVFNNETQELLFSDEGSDADQ